jgi:acyl-ACP thioesterase
VDGGRVEVASLWVYLGVDGQRPTRLPAWFTDTYGEAALGRHVGARLVHPAPPPGAVGRPWPLRATDLDVLRHVNNAATWQAVEDEAWRRGVVPRRAELEYGAALDPDDDVVLRSSDEGDGRLPAVADGGGDGAGVGPRGGEALRAGRRRGGRDEQGTGRSR